MDQEFRCHAEVEFGGERLAMNQIITRFDVADIMPSHHHPTDPLSVARHMEAQERRRRLVDLIAAEFAHALTEALFKRARR